MVRIPVALLALVVVSFAQIVGTPVNVAFPSNLNLTPADQPLLAAPDGSYVAVTGSQSSTDVVITEIDATGTLSQVIGLGFPSSNNMSATNPGLVMSRYGSFLCCYGSNTSGGDLVFISWDTSGTWFAQNVAFNGSTNAAAVGITPVISPDEEFIVCRGNTASDDLVIIPVDWSAGYPQPDTPVDVSFPSSNGIALIALNPVVAPNSLSLAIPATNTSGDLVVVTVPRPITSNSVTATNISFPSGNGVVNATAAVAVSPDSNYYAVHALPTIGDLVVVQVDVTGAPTTTTGILWPQNNNTASTLVPPTISNDGRLVAVNGTQITSNGDLILLPMADDGTPGTPLPVGFPSNNNYLNASLPPVISGDAALVLQSGSASTGDLVAVQVTFTSASVVTTVETNVSYPSNNFFPSADAGIALAPDRSFCASLGGGSLGDLVITPFDLSGAPQTPINVLYPSNNNVINTAATPSIAGDGMTLLTSGTDSIGDAVVTCLEVDVSTGYVQVKSVENVPYASNNFNSPQGREPIFDPSGQIIVSAGTANTGDLVIAPMEQAVAHVLAPRLPGTAIPLRFRSPQDPGQYFLAGASLGRYPGLTLPDSRVIPLNPDPVLQLSLFPANPFFIGFSGFFDADGNAPGQVNLPYLPQLRGLWLYLAFVVADVSDPTGIGTISQPATFQIE